MMRFYAEKSDYTDYIDTGLRFPTADRQMRAMYRMLRSMGYSPGVSRSLVFGSLIAWIDENPGCGITVGTRRVFTVPPLARPASRG